ncbi:MAG: response regulator transcription factor [Ferrovibrionaceae bacterium]
MALILAVEDDPVLLRLVGLALKDAGHDVITATNGREGLAAVLRHRPALVVSDITMPEMDGFAFLKALRDNHRQFADMPFIFLSGLSERKDIIAGRALGVDDYVTKPIDADLLIAVVDSRLAQVARMRALKDQQMVKLYRRLTRPDDEADAPAASPVVPAAAPSVRIVAVTNSEVAIEPSLAALEKAGIGVERLRSGRALIDAVASGAPDLVLISYNTDDLQAPLAVITARGSCDYDFPALLLVPPAMTDLLRVASVPGFDEVIAGNAPERDLLSAIYGLLSPRGAAQG